MMANAAVDPQISGGWILSVITSLGAIILGIWGKSEREKAKAAESKTKTKIEGQPIGVKLKREFVTYEVMDGHLERIEGDISDIKETLEGERGIARTANGNVHKRIDALSERLGDRLAKLEGTTDGIKGTTDKLLDIALGKKPAGR